MMKLQNENQILSCSKAFPINTRKIPNKLLTKNNINIDDKKNIITVDINKNITTKNVIKKTNLHLSGNISSISAKKMIS